MSQGVSPSRLLFVIKSLTVRGGGAERVLAEVAQELARRGHSVCVASFDTEGSEPFYSYDASVRLARLGVGDVRRKTGAGEIVQRIAALRRLAAVDRPDMAIGFMHSSYVPLAFALAGRRIPVIGSEHIVFEHYKDVPVERASLYLATPCLSAMTAVSEQMRDTFPFALRRLMRVIPNPVPSVAEPANVIGGSSKTILSVGRLEEQKDHATLIAAFATLARDFPDWKLRIVGDGSLRSALRNQAEQLNLVDRVELPGAVRDIATEYLLAQLFVLSSRYESFGLATAEAMAHGLPAIGFADCAGTNELIHDGVNGILVTGADRPKTLSDAMSRLMSSDEQRRRIGAAARESLARHSIGRIAGYWEDLLETYGH